MTRAKWWWLAALATFSAAAAVGELLAGELGWALVHGAAAMVLSTKAGQYPDRRPIP